MNSPDGSVFTTVDFADVIENSRVGVILSRLEELCEAYMISPYIMIF